jgi:hypothetical protein
MGNVIPLKQFSHTVDYNSKDYVSSPENIESKETIDFPDTVEPGTAGTDFDNDLVHLSATKLRKKYHREYNSFRNMSPRAKEHGGTVDPEFKTFKGFLSHVGPCPGPDFTLDRIDNENRDYGPDLVRWADKKTQNNNKGDTVFLTDSDGTKRPLTEWAQRTGQKANTLRGRCRSGWSDTEVIHGRKLSRDRVWNITPWPEGKEKHWERLYQRHVMTGNHSQNGGDRVDFLRRFSRYEVVGYTKQLERLEYLNLDADLTEKSLARIVELKKLIKEFEGYVALAERKRQRENSLERKKSFANRTGGLGREIESTLWEQVHG